jgi:hydrogenase maturation protease
VLGIGNLLWSDEGFGVRAVEAFHARHALPENVSVVDGGTQGLYLLDAVCAAQQVLVFDAIDYALPPGTLRVLRDAEVPTWSDTTMSLHQASFMELLSLAQLRGRFPQRITVIGVQPEVMDDLGGSLSAVVRGRLDEAVDLAVAELARWGHAATARSAPPEAPLNAGALAIEAYEGQRPAADSAFRLGDARFLNQVHGQEPG